MTILANSRIGKAWLVNWGGLCFNKTTPPKNTFQKRESYPHGVAQEGK